MSRARRIPDTQWEVHKETIQSLYQNMTIKQMMGFMADNYQFHATEKQYVRKVIVNWKFRKNTTKEEWEQVNSLVLKRKAEGKLTQLTIHGKIIPDKRSKRAIRRYAPRDKFGSPVLSRIGSVAVRTPPTSHRVITYFTLPCFNLQTQFSSHMLGNGLHPILDRPIASINDSNSTMSSLSIFRNQITTESSLRRISAMLEWDEHTPFCHWHSTELQARQSETSAPWSRLFLSMAFLSTNNRCHRKALVRFLELAICCGLLQDLKQVLSMKGPTIKLFSVALLSAALNIPHGRGFDFAQYLLQQGVNPNSADSTWTSLQRAVAFKDKGAVRLLLDYGADPFASFPRLQPRDPSQMEIYDNETFAEILLNMRCHFLRTPLSLAVETKDEVRARQLLQAGANPNLFHPKDLSPLHVAVRFENATMVSLLIEFGADPNLFCRADMTTTLKMVRSDISPNYPIFLGTPLQNAVKLKQFTIVERLLQAGANPDGMMDLDMSTNSEKICYESKSDFTALRHAIKSISDDILFGRPYKRTYELFKLLLEAGAGVDTRHPMQPTALQYVCGNESFGKHRIGIAKLLLERGADVNARLVQPDGKIALEAAAELGDADLVELLLREGATCSNPTSILQLAVASGCQKLVNFLIGLFSKANLSTLNVDDTWVEYLEAAARSGSAQLVGTILKKCSDKSTEKYEKHVVNAMEVAASHNKSEALYRLLLSGVNPNADGRVYSILSEAIPRGEDSDTCFSLLMSRCATLQLDLDQPPPGKPTLLWKAIARENMAVAQRLIISGANINCPSLCIGVGEGNRLETPMAQAILCKSCMYHDPDYDLDHVCPVDFLIMSGVNVDDIVNGSMTALLLALKAENHKVVERLLRHGANPNIRDSETRRHVFDIALAEKYWQWPLFSTLKSLVDHGFECNGELNDETIIQKFSKELTNGIWSGDWQPVEFAKLLIDAGAEVNTPSTEESPMTALQYAIDASEEEFTNTLLGAGADVHAPAFWKTGKTALQAACNIGNLGLVRNLVAQGVDINAQPASHYGATALQFAAIQGHIEIAIFLLENGALINAPAGLVEGRTALQGAAEHGRLDMIFLLLENDQDDGLEERCQEAARFAEKESRFEVAQILREYRKV